MSVVTNVVLMALTAGRIWWIRRDASVLADCASVRRYNMVIAIILESGAIYCLSVIIYVTIVSILNPGNFSPLIDIFRGVVPQIMNIAPALIIVRVGLGYNGSGSEQQQSESAGSRPAAANGDPDPMLLRVMDISARRRNSNAAVADPERQV
ncbi:hypothetical protein C8R43DRAFT_968240 [Mycena crocata]|nr:hypothetical protein C8R43DRAFT_968240 [Mycena crocata]